MNEERKDLLGAIWTKATAPFTLGAALGATGGLIVSVAFDIGIDYALWAVIIGAILGLILFGFLLYAPTQALLTTVGWI